jgi:hypothetical protein
MVSPIRQFAMVPVRSAGSSRTSVPPLAWKVTPAAVPPETVSVPAAPRIVPEARPPLKIIRAVSSSA